MKASPPPARDGDGPRVSGDRRGDIGHGSDVTMIPLLSALQEVARGAIRARRSTPGSAIGHRAARILRGLARDLSRRVRAVELRERRRKVPA